MSRSAPARVIGARTSVLAALAVVRIALAAGPAAALPNEADVVVVNAAPGARIDARLDGATSVSGLGYRLVAPAASASPGRHRVEVAEGGKVVEIDVEVVGGELLLVVAWRNDLALGAFAVRAALPAPPSGRALVRVVNAVQGAPAIGLRDGKGRSLTATALPGAASGYFEVDATTDVVNVVAGGGGAPIATSRLTPNAGSVYTLVAVGGGEAVPTLVAVLDAVGVTLVPTGPPEAGIGPRPPSLPRVWPFFAGGLLVLVGLSFFSARRIAAVSGFAVASVAVATLTSCAGSDVNPPLASTGTTSSAEGTRNASASEIAQEPPVGEVRPVGIVISSVGVRADILPMQSLDDPEVRRVLGPSRDVRRTAGWYSASPVPGRVGPAVIVGHINYDAKNAVFHELGDRSLPVGSAVEVSLSDGEILRFVIRDIREYPKSDFPIAEVFAPTSRPELRLVTCGGSFDTVSGHYRNSVVAYASLVGSTP